MKTKIYGPFSLREELNEKETLLADSHGITFLSDPKYNDWYQLQKQFSPDTLKIVFDEKGVINAASYDASTLWPQSFNLAEVNFIPENFKKIPTGGEWVFDGEKITLRVYSGNELAEQVAYKKNTLLTEASVIISPLQDAKELGIATVNELAELNKWMLYRVSVSRIDPKTAPDIIWPDIPA